MLKKGRKFEWGAEHTEVVWKLKESLTETPALWKVVYKRILQFT